MKKILFLSIFLSSTIPVAFADECDYSSIDETEYKISDSYAKYVKNDFYAFPDKDTFNQGTLEDYLSLIKNPFKLTNPIAFTKKSMAYKDYLSEFRFHDLVIDDHAYYTDNLYHIEVTTSDCKKFYLEASYLDPDSFEFKFNRSDNQPITRENYFNFTIGVLNPSNIKTNSKYDEFEGKTSVKTEYFDNYLIRGYFDSAKNEFDYIQVYLDLTSTTKSPDSTEERTWNNIVLAKDTDAKPHNVIQIDNDVECDSESMFGCTMTETIAVDVDEDFLRKHENGFRLKLIGKYPTVEKINQDVIKSFLDETDRLRQSK